MNTTIGIVTRYGRVIDSTIILQSRDASATALIAEMTDGILRP
ncbi:MAG TPA: hypothetical protein VHM67_15320 [Gemmatimonadaceae bacterium]|nr:hypothetical protein [Gemmatimonadaceae bacterium]